MTTIADGSSSSRRPHPRIKAVADWGGHHWIALLLAGIVAGPFVDRLPHSWVGVTKIAVAAILVPALLLGVRHDTKLCERCAARTPLNGDVAAARYARRLHLMHLRPPWFTFILATLPVSFLPYWWAAFAGELAIMPLSIYAWVSSRTHRQLYPWCPRCKWGRGGDGIKEPSPDPSIDAPNPQMA